MPYQDPTSAIQSLYKQYGMRPGGRGSGFADLDYWAEQANKTGGWSDYWQNRLGSNLAGTGPDMPTGTLGTGPWQQSGRGSSMPRTTIPPSGTSGGWWNPPGYAPTMVPPSSPTAQNPWQQWLGGMPRTLPQGDESDQSAKTGFMDPEQVRALLAQIFGSDPSTWAHIQSSISDRNPSAIPSSQQQQPDLERIIQRALSGAYY